MLGQASGAAADHLLPEAMVVRAARPRRGREGVHHAECPRTQLGVRRRSRRSPPPVKRSAWSRLWRSVARPVGREGCCLSVKTDWRPCFVEDPKGRIPYACIGGLPHGDERQPRLGLRHRPPASSGTTASRSRFLGGPCRRVCARMRLRRRNSIDFWHGRPPWQGRSHVSGFHRGGNVAGRWWNDHARRGNGARRP